MKTPKGKVGKLLIFGEAYFCKSLKVLDAKNVEGVFRSTGTYNNWGFRNQVLALVFVTSPSS
jgi:hypothetical protein